MVVRIVENKLLELPDTIMDVPLLGWFIDSLGHLGHKDDEGKFVCFGEVDAPTNPFVHEYDVNEEVEILKHEPYILISVTKG